jgi:HEAT repeat protein
MPKRIAIAMLALFCAVAGVVLFRAFFSDEPQYRGRRLGQWFKQYYRSGQWSQRRDEANHREAARAFRAIGMNAIPFLVKECFSTSQDLPVATNLLMFLGDFGQPLKFPPFVPAMCVREDAAAAIAEIKPPASLLLPLVTNHLHALDKYERYMATWLLGWVGKGREACVPFLREKLHASDQWERTLGVIGLERFGPAALPATAELVEILRTDSTYIYYSCRALAHLGPAASNAVPVLQEKLAGETNAYRRMRLTGALVCIEPQPERALEWLQTGLAADQPVDQRSGMIRALGEAGPSARIAVPTLVDLMKDDQQQIWEQAGAALLGIGETNLALAGALEKLKSPDPATRYTATPFVLRIQPTNAAAISNLFEFIGDPKRADQMMSGLARLGVAAKPVVPVLREIAANPTNRLRYAAQQALREIEAESEDAERAK